MMPLFARIPWTSHWPPVIYLCCLAIGIGFGLFTLSTEVLYCSTCMPFLFFKTCTIADSIPKLVNY